MGKLYQICDYDVINVKWLSRKNVFHSCVLFCIE